MEDWKRVIWSDETKINRLGYDGREWVWEKTGEQLSERHVQETMKFCGGSLMMWGCMTDQGVGFACKIDGGMDATLYTNILQDELLQTLDFYELNRDNIIFQQDNGPKHTSIIARKWFNDNRIQLLGWPAQSPDLKPIEQLWQYLKRHLATYESEPVSVHEL